jgi:diguanylate cyclase (GGDEF)-like protein
LIADEQRAARLATTRLIAFSLSLTAVAIGVWWMWLRGLGPLPGAPFEVSIAFLACAFAVTELVSVHLESRGEAHAITFSEIPFVAGLLFAAPDELVLARVFSGLLVLGLVRRQSWHKLVFNLSLFAAEIAVGAAVYRAILGTADPASVGAWPAMFAAIIASQLLDFVAVTGAISIYSGWLGGRLVRQVVLYGGLSSLANTATGLAISVSVWNQTYSGALIVAVVIALFALYRSFMGLTERYKNLATLHDFTRALAEAEPGQLEEAVAEGALTILRGERAALLTPPGRDGDPATRVVTRGDASEKVSISPTELEADLLMLFPTGEPRLYGAGEPLPGWLGEIGIKDAVMVPLMTDGTAVGAMVVANRLTEVSTFVEDDVRVFETLANHASVALANGRLVATLQHDAQEKAYQALHDPLTGLPNRTMLQERLQAAIAEARGTDLGVALLFVDLVTFKEVNDTLGIATGDRLLIEVRQRIEAMLPMSAQLARFTGDQFAILVSDVDDRELVISLAEQLVTAFDTPFTADDVSLVLGANLGVALYPDHATNADLLFQRADAATYRARQEGSGIEVYAAETDPYAPRRLALAADLRDALENGQVDVYVQPKLALLDGAVVGAEALVRWEHPIMGTLSPDQFIPAAEHTGVIRQLTAYVVRNALAQCRHWRDAGLDLSISVNLSGRNLFDGHLVEDIGAAIADAGVPADVLTLELTESTVMGESHRSMTVLEGLRELGVRLSVDDFGTGYSSLTHLRSLPVTELKIDKSFVMTMTVNDQDAVIVRTLVDLGRSLGLRTVAEGVESQEARDMLRDFGCDEAQGYLFSRAIPAEQFTAWLTRHDVRRIRLDDAVIPFARDQRRVVGDDPR